MQKKPSEFTACVRVCHKLENPEKHMPLVFLTNSVRLIAREVQTVLDFSDLLPELFQGMKWVGCAMRLGGAFTKVNFKK